MDRIEECGMDEGPMPGAMPPAPMDQGTPVTMNVNLTASGKQHVEDLVKMMQHAGLGDAEPVSAKTLAPRLDMERLRGIVDEPENPGKDDVEGDQDLDAGMGGTIAGGAIGALAGGPLGALTGAAAGDQLTDEDGYENAPDEEYGDIEDVTVSGNDLHKSKKGYKAAAGGDNPMSFEDEIRERLMAALEEKKMPMGPGPDGKKGTDDDKPAFLDQKTGAKKSKSGSKPKKGVVPPQFKKK